MAETHWEFARSVVPAAVLDALLACVEDEALTPADAVAGALDDPDLGPVARNLITLWYCGTWTRLPDDWRARNGAAPGDETRVVSSAAYQAGLQWTAVGAHPAGARPQGFGSWSLQPAGAGS